MLAVAAWFGALSAWNAARIWTPYDQRVSFSGSRLVSPEFEINTEGWYGVCVSLPEGDESSWEVLEGGRTVAKGRGHPGWWNIGDFQGHNGRYVLVLQPNQGAAGLAHVWVEENGGLRETTGIWLAFSGDLLVLIVAINLGVFVRSIIVRRIEARDAAARAASLTQPGSLGPAPRVDSAIRHPWDLRARPRPDFTRLSWHGFILLIVVFGVFVPVFIFQIWTYTPRGFPIRLLRPGIQGVPVPHLEPLVVRVEKGLNSGPLPQPDWQSMSSEQVRLYQARADDHILYFNSQRISWDQLGPLLDKELMRRPPDWPVYVRGDGDLEWGQVARAIDIIRGKGAQVVLVTDWGKPK
jgi:hypothetical protein